MLNWHMNPYGFFNAKTIIVKCSKKYYLSGGIRGFNTFLWGLSLRVNVVTQIVFELAYFEAVMQYIIRYTTDTHLRTISWFSTM